LLSLRRGNPEMLFLSAATGRDLGYALKNLTEIGWKVPILGGGAFGTLAAQAAAVSGPEALRNVLAFTYTGMTACPKDPLGTTLYAQLLAKLKKQEPGNYDKISHFNVASGYDLMYMLKYAATGAGSIDGSKMTAWMEENAQTMKLVYSPIRASRDDHFLLGPEAETMGIDVMTPRADGTLKRAGC
jgi:branched-chain amino acid transport system substrate-binding protein